jgi:hypothetical protein
MNSVRRYIDRLFSGWDYNNNNMAEAQLFSTSKKRLHKSMIEDRDVEILLEGEKKKKKQKSEVKSKHKSPSMVLHLTPNVILAIWREKENIRIQIDDGEKKINIPPDVWRILHLSSEAISLLLSFVEGQGGIAEYYDKYYSNYHQRTENSQESKHSTEKEDTVNIQLGQCN